MRELREFGEFRLRVFSSKLEVGEWVWKLVWMLEARSWRLECLYSSLASRHPASNL
jgi:hypothetical protein